jgi:hypothetical protein
LKWKEFQGKKGRIATRLKAGEPRESIAHVEHTTVHYVNNVASAMHKMKIPIKHPTQAEPINSQIALPLPGDSSPHLGAGDVTGQTNLLTDIPSPGISTNLSTFDNPELIALAKTNAELQKQIHDEKQKDALQSQNRNLVNEQKEIAAKRDIKRMLTDGNFYKKRMKEHATENPEILSSFHTLKVQLQPDITFNEIEADKDRRISEQWEQLNRLAKQWPRITQRLGYGALDFPVDSSFLDEQWNYILEELRSDWKFEDLTQWSKVQPGPCPYDGSKLKHKIGGIFICELSHEIIYRCPKCQSVLVYNACRLVCYTCFRKLFEY